jgi:hypothetical protein
MSLDADRLAGEMQLCPGAPLGVTLRSSRPNWVPRLTAGRLASEVPHLLGAVFTLCSHAHRWTAARAIAHAMGQPAVPTDTEAQAHRLATVREQLLRLGHDWPRLLPGASAQAPLLQGCPLWPQVPDADVTWAALNTWLADQWLGCTPAAWLQALDADPAGWPLRWAQAGQGALAALLGPQAAACAALPAAGPVLNLLHDPARHMPGLAAHMDREPGFCTQPHWLNAVPDTGPWTRIHDLHPRTVLTAWDRLVARVVDLLRLAAPGGERWLQAGGMSLAAGEGMAWTEMARGLLVHWVRLDAMDDGPARVAAYRVLAPTEWNFHPRGTLAQALHALPPGPASHDAAARLAVAFDPCVRFGMAGASGLGEDANLAKKGATHHA